MIEVQPIDARILRLQGKLAGIRPTETIAKIPLEISPPNLETAPKAPVDALLILGIGPVKPVLRGPDNDRRVVIDDESMRHNVMGGLEAVAHGLVKIDGVVIPTGTATADPMVVSEAIKLRAENIRLEKVEERLAQFITSRDAPTPDEAQKVFTATEAQLMADLYNKAFAMSGVNGEKLGVEVFVDKFATETASNFIFALNELDARSRKKGQGLFNGNIAVVTSRYHIARTMEIARYLGLGDKTVPLVSQEILRSYGYEGRLYKNGNEDFDLATRWNEQKWIRAVHQMPEYFLPVLNEIVDPERFVQTLQHVKQLYGDEVFTRFGLNNLDLTNEPELRKAVSAIVRKNPKEEDWMRTDTAEVNTAIDMNVAFTREWVRENTPNSTPIPERLIGALAESI